MAVLIGGAAALGLSIGLVRGNWFVLPISLIVTLPLWGVVLRPRIDCGERELSCRGGGPSWRIPLADISGYEWDNSWTAAAVNRSYGLNIVTYGGATYNVSRNTFSLKALRRVAAYLDAAIERNLA